MKVISASPQLVEGGPCGMGSFMDEESLGLRTQGEG